MKTTDRWNRIIYGFWSPIYDILIRAPFIVRARTQAIDSLDLRSGDRVILVGVGTGADLPLMPEGISAVGLDLSRAMLARARAKLPLAGRGITLLQGNAAALPFDSDTFDAAVLTLILSVVPDGGACLRETFRVLRPGGRAIVFDKFLSEHSKATFGRRLLNVLTGFFGTDINRRFGEISAGVDFEKSTDCPVLLGGTYRVLLLTKPSTSN